MGTPLAGWTLFGSGSSRIGRSPFLRDKRPTGAGDRPYDLVQIDAAHLLDSAPAYGAQLAVQDWRIQEGGWTAGGLT